MPGWVDMRHSQLAAVRAGHAAVGTDRLAFFRRKQGHIYHGGVNRMIHPPHRASHRRSLAHG
jgi:hypothetical protein